MFIEFPASLCFLGSQDLSLYLNGQSHVYYKELHMHKTPKYKLLLITDSSQVSCTDKQALSHTLTAMAWTEQHKKQTYENFLKEEPFFQRPPSFFLPFGLAISCIH